jgi:BirA family biotin operon repressor/biotin-[acetyl-CoA-carboxylase] ligase
METLFIGQELLRYQSLDSTNTRIKSLLRENIRVEGLTVQSEYQTLGRGQFGNSWEAEKGKNLLFSVLLKPNFLKPDRQFFLNMSVCLAVADSLNDLCPGFRVKWPNDILFEKKKLGGILIENSISSSKIDHSIIGVGLNINQREFSDNRLMTSLYSILGNQTDLNFLLEKILKKLEIRYLNLKAGKQGIYSDYYSLLYGYNENVPVRIGQKSTLAKIIGVEPSGYLIAEVEGSKKRFDFKEIVFIRS